MKSDIKCSRCGFKQAEYFMHRVPDVHCTNMYKCLVRRMERVEEHIEGLNAKANHNIRAIQTLEATKVPLDLRGKEMKVGGTD